MLKEEENVAVLLLQLKLENMLCSGLFIFNCFSSILFASSKIPLHLGKLLKEAASVLLFWSFPSMSLHQNCQNETFLLLSHHLLKCPVAMFFCTNIYSFCLIAEECSSFFVWLFVCPVSVPHIHCWSVSKEGQIKTVKGLESQSYEGQLGKLWWVSLEKRRLRGRM